MLKWLTLFVGKYKTSKDTICMLAGMKLGTLMEWINNDSISSFMKMKIMKYEPARQSLLNLFHEHLSEDESLSNLLLCNKKKSLKNNIHSLQLDTIFLNLNISEVKQGLSSERPFSKMNYCCINWRNKKLGPHLFVYEVEKRLLPCPFRKPNEWSHQRQIKISPTEKRWLIAIPIGISADSFSGMNN